VPRARTLSLACAVLLGASLGAPRVHAADRLTVCLEEHNPPYSDKRAFQRSGSGGFDLAVANAVARRLGRDLSVRWFELESLPDEDSTPSHEINALLSAHLCDLAGGYALFASALGQPPVPTARPPDYDGATRDDRHRWITLGALQPSRAYHFAPFTVVLGPRAAGVKITSLADLDGLRLVAEQGTLAEALLMLYANRRYAERIVHVTPGHGLLEQRLEHGDFDATLMEQHRFDAYRARHPDTRLKSSGYYHPIGFNMGFVGLAAESDLIRQVDDALGEMLAQGELEALARAAGMTYVPPRAPEVRDRLSLQEMMRR